MNEWDLFSALSDIDPSMILEATEEPPRPRKQIRRRGAIIIAFAAVLVFLTACFSVPQIQQKIYEIVIAYRDKCYSFKSELTGESEQPPSTLTIPRLPTYLPEGYTEVCKEAQSTFVHVTYLHTETGCGFFYTQRTIGSIEYKLNAEGVEVWDVTVNGSHAVAVFRHADSSIFLLWNDAEYDYSILTSTLSLEEILAIAESVH